MDANFGLCRRKAAGKSVHPPLSGGEFFFEQSKVDNYVTQYQCQADSNTQVRIHVSIHIDKYVRILSIYMHTCNCKV